MSEKHSQFSRRDFIGSIAAAGAIGLACSGGAGNNTVEVPWAPLLETAPDGPKLKAGVIGCGGRGTGATLNFLSAGPNLEIAALGDLFQDRIDGSRKKLKAEKGVEVPDDKCFVGFDAFKRVIDAGVDLVILATPPHFRPEHFAAAINAKKHVFMEKPVAVDPVGARSIMASSKKAEALGLSVATGTQRRHQRDYIATYKQIASGAIGDIVAGYAYWNQSQLWYRERKRGWSEMEWMLRDWVNWVWASGDHIVEQHVHNIDVINWFMGAHPVKAVGFGSRQRRVTGDQYDNFSVDFVYENGVHMHSMCRQINGCANNVSEFIQGSKGSSNARNSILDKNGKEVWKYEYPLGDDGNPTNSVKISPYVQEHIDLVTAIRTNTPFVEAENTAISTLTAIMGRISAYTGKETTWDEMMASDLELKPAKYKLGKSVLVKSKPAVPGSKDR